jgi:hypothetical protein
MARTPPAVLLSIVLLATSLAACGASTSSGGSGGSGGAMTVAAGPPAASHPLPVAGAAPARAVDPVAPSARPASSILSPSRVRAPLIRERPDPGSIVAPDAAGPEAPYAAAYAKPADCASPRPTACNLDYKPVCAGADTGVRCIRAPCPASERKTFSSACKACRDPGVTSYVAGRCPPPA